MHRYRGYGFGTRLFLECMAYLAKQGIEYALITVQDNGSGKLIPFYEAMGYISASNALGIEQFDSSTLMLAKLNISSDSSSSNKNSKQDV
jgi:Acetyltransferase (GNAT) domain